MNNTLSDLTLKVKKLERQIDQISSLTNKYFSSDGVKIEKDFLNYSCIDKERLKVGVFKSSIQKEVLIESDIEVYSAVNQEVLISLIVDGFSVKKIKISLVSGDNVLNISSVYKVISLKEISVFIEIESVEKKQVIIKKSSLKIWGGDLEKEVPKYSIIDIGDKWLLSFLKNKNIYYKIITKMQYSYNEIDFEFYAKALDYCWAYQSSKNNLFLFRVDFDGNLFIHDIKNNNIVFIDDNVSVISVAYSENKVISSYLKNNKLYILEFQDLNEITTNYLSYNYIIKNTKIIYNKYNNKFFLILMLNTGVNLMFEADDSVKSYGDKLLLDYNISITLYEVNDEN